MCGSVASRVGPGGILKVSCCASRDDLQSQGTGHWSQNRPDWIRRACEEGQAESPSQTVGKDVLDSKL